MVAIVAANLHVEIEYAQGRTEDGPHLYVAGWRVYLDEIVGGGIDCNRQQRGDGVNYWSHQRLWESLEAAEEFKARIIDSGRTEIDEQHWEMIGSDFRTWDDIEQEWNQFALQERNMW